MENRNSSKWHGFLTRFTFSRIINHFRGKSTLSKQKATLWSKDGFKASMKLNFLSVHILLLWTRNLPKKYPITMAWKRVYINQKEFLIQIFVTTSAHCQTCYSFSSIMQADSLPKELDSSFKGYPNITNLAWPPWIHLHTNISTVSISY